MTEKITVQCCLAKELKGLFGSGKEEGERLRKPHKFVLELDSNGVPFITSFFSSCADDLYRPACPVLRALPRLSDLKCYDLESQFLLDKATVVSSWEKQGVKIGEAGFTLEQLESYKSLPSGFSDVTAVRNPFGEPSNGFSALLQRLGPMRNKGQRNGPKRKKTQHEEDSDRGDKDYDSDAPDDEDDDVEEFSSDEVEQDEWEVERIIRSDWNFERQQYFYLVVVRGSHLLEEWIPEDDMNGGPIYDAFVAERDRASVAKRSAVAASSFQRY